MKYKRTILLAQNNECKCICRINVIHFQKQLIPTNANLAMVFICKLFQSRLQVSQFKWRFTDLVHVKAIAIFITRVQHLVETCSGKYIVGNPSNISFTFPQSSEKRSLHLIQKFAHPYIWKIIRDLYFIASQKQQVAKRIFGVFSLAKVGCLDLLAGLSCFFLCLRFCCTLS